MLQHFCQVIPQTIGNAESEFQRWKYSLLILTKSFTNMAEEKILKSQAITLTQKIPIQPLKTPENLCFYTP